MAKKHKTFPIVVDPEWLDRLGRAVNLSKEYDSKYELVIRATEKEMEQIERDSVKK